MDDQTVHIFWDNSNLFHRLQATCDDGEGGGVEPGHRLDVRVNFRAMLEFASAGRTVEKAVAVGSIPPDLEALWERMGSVGLVVGLQERGADTGKEIAVDEELKLEMLNSVVDRQIAGEPPAVAVLVSGDGDFREVLDRMIGSGWGVEALSFSKGFSNRLKQIARGSHGRAKYLNLDPWYDQLSYCQELDSSGTKVVRESLPLDLSDRPKV